MMKHLQIFTKCAKAVLQCRRFSHSFCISKMFPYDELDFQKNTAERMVDDTDSKYEGSLSYSLMMKHKLLHSSSSGSFSFTPSMLRSQAKLQTLIDAEMQGIGAQKVSLPCLSPKALWEKSGRWDVMSSELFRLDDRAGASFCLSPTHEEVITNIVASESPVSYKRLPIKLYQIGKKFRDEKRPKHGLLRCREFDMKDLYTFDASVHEAQTTFNEVCGAYEEIINWLDIHHMSVEASSGSMGGSQSKEFHLLSPVGEDTLFTCDKCGKSYNKELLDENGNSNNTNNNSTNNNNTNNNNNCPKQHCHDDMKQFSGIEIAHAFILDTKYSDHFKARFIDQAGNKKSLVMGCYGIGVGRLLAASLEILSTHKHLRFPRLLAPYQICILPQKNGYKSDVTDQMAHQLYHHITHLSNLTHEVTIDDRTHFSIGQRIKQASAIGYPFVIALGKKALDEQEPLYELIDIYKDESNFLNLNQLLSTLSTFPSVQI